MNLFERLRSRAYLAYARQRRGMTLGVRAAVFDADDGVFLVRHSYTPGWYLPGGGVERGETMHDALERELMEEGGLALDGPAELFGLYLNRKSSPRDHVALYVCRHWRRAKAFKVPNFEIVECGFYPQDDLPKGATDATRRRIDEIRTAAPPPVEW